MKKRKDKEPQSPESAAASDTAAADAGEGERFDTLDDAGGEGVRP